MFPCDVKLYFILPPPTWPRSPASLPCRGWGAPPPPHSSSRPAQWGDAWAPQQRSDRCPPCQNASVPDNYIESPVITSHSLSSSYLDKVIHGVPDWFAGDVLQHRQKGFKSHPGVRSLLLAINNHYWGYVWDISSRQTANECVMAVWRDRDCG